MRLPSIPLRRAPAPVPAADPADEDVVRYRFADEADGEEAERTLILLLGREDPSLALIDAAARGVEAAGRRAIVVATDLPPSVLVTALRPIELLPRRRDLPALEPAEYAVYLRRRWLVLQSKWAPRREIVLGKSFEDFLADELGA